MVYMKQFRLFLLLISLKECLALEKWENFFLKGDYKLLNSAIKKIPHWEHVLIHRIPILIENHYKGDLKMARRIYSSLHHIQNTKPDVLYAVKTTGYLALCKAMKNAGQDSENLVLKMAAIMSRLTSVLSTNIVKMNVKRFKAALLPSIKSICFDKWIRMRSPDSDLYLAINGSQVGFWPDNQLNADSYKWYLHTRFRTHTPILEIHLKNVEKKMKHYVEVGAEFNWNSSASHWWMAELLDGGRFRLKNKENKKYLRMSQPHEVMTLNGRMLMADLVMDEDDWDSFEFS